MVPGATPTWRGFGPEKIHFDDSCSVVPTVRSSVEQVDCCGPSKGSHHSRVQALPSSCAAEPDAVHSPAALQEPSVQMSTEQLVPTGAGAYVTTPVAGSHVPWLHGLLVSIDTGVPGWQLPDALHVSLPLQRSASLQLEPAGRGVL
jgi:hypothetical protein